MTARDRLQWRCRRGMRELDLLLGRFLACEFDELSPADQARFETLLDYHDQELLVLLTGRGEPADPDLSDIISRIASQAGPSYES